MAERRPHRPPETERCSTFFLSENHMDRPPTLSIVLPVFNEEANLPELHRRLEATLQPMELPYEMVYVDDGSSDDSLGCLRKMAEADPRVVVLSLSRNFGHQVALTAGLEHSRGDAVVLMDSDLQDPPELLPELVARWEQGYDIVYAQRRDRPGESTFKRGTAYLFYRVLRAITRVNIPPDTGDFRLLSRPAADALRRLPEGQRFLRGLVAWIGFRQGKVLYDRPARRSGESKYRLRHMIRLAKTGAFSFSNVPVALIGLSGLLACGTAVLGVLLTEMAGMSAAMLFLGGVQLLGLWVLGEYVTTIAAEVRRRPLYVVRETLNLQSTPASDA